MFADWQPAALSPLPAGYRELFSRLLDVAAADHRVRAVWLSGSAGRGTADAGSDLDVVLAVADEAFGEFTASWRNWLARVTPTVLARELPGLPGSWCSLTPACERFDAVTVRATAGPRGGAEDRLLVLHKDRPGPPGPAAVDATVPASAGRDKAVPDEAGPETTPGPDPSRIAAITEEFLRQQAIFPAAVVARADWLLGVQGVQGVYLMLYQLFVESNQPLPVMGIKQWSARLTPAQREICAGLPPPAADRQSVLAAMQAAASTFRAQATLILAAHRVPWPGDLDMAVLAYQARTLGW